MANQGDAMQWRRERLRDLLRKGKPAIEAAAPVEVDTLLGDLDFARWRRSAWTPLAVSVKTLPHPATPRHQLGALPHFG